MKFKLTFEIDNNGVTDELVADAELADLSLAMADNPDGMIVMVYAQMFKGLSEEMERMYDARELYKREDSPVEVAQGETTVITYGS